MACTFLASLQRGTVSHHLRKSPNLSRERCHWQVLLYITLLHFNLLYSAKLCFTLVNLTLRGTCVQVGADPPITFYWGGCLSLAPPPLPFFSLPLPPPSFTFRSTSLFSLLGALARVPALREFVLPAPCYHRHIPRVIHMACRIQRDLEFHPPTPIQVTRAHDCPQLKAHHSITCPIIVFSGRAKLRGDCEVRGPAGVPARVPIAEATSPSSPQAEANQAESPFKPRVQTCTTQRAKGTYAGPPCWPRRAAASAQKLTAPEERASGWSICRPQVLNRKEICPCVIER